LARGLSTVALILAVLLGTTGCTEEDESLDLVGVAQLTLQDSQLAQQDLFGSVLQEVEFPVVSRALLTIGDRQIDLLAGSGCLMGDTIVLLPFAGGKCNNGVAINEERDPVATRLELSLTMKANRAEPAGLMTGGDLDMDGVIDDNDICPLIPDPGQEDADMNGLGDACEGISLLTGMAEMDSDADGITDDLDNCVAVANPLQADSAPLDGIGDLCTEESADVLLNGSTSIDLTVNPGPLTLAELQTLFVVVDFVDQDALQCDFNAGTCDLDASAVRACLSFDPLGSSLGCP
jgi:hypothetical protein